MKRFSVWMILFLGIVGFTIFQGCETSGGSNDTPSTDNKDGTSDGDSDTDSDADVDSDSDTDSDTDSDGDSDSDSDADSDSDSDSDADVNSCDDCVGFQGADVLVVVDNSLSMEEEQQILATGFFTLINTLIAPPESMNWKLNPAQNIRVGIVSSDLGLQYGEKGSVDGWPYTDDEPPTGCEKKKGDDGVFQQIRIGEITVESGQIACDADVKQCPTSEWTCSSDMCAAPGGNGLTTCPTTLAGGQPWSETTKDAFNDAMAEEVSCLAQLGKEGCGVEQQLQAGIKALSRKDQAGFIRDNHLLAVIVVSDEEDCSVKDKGLFDTKEWSDGSMNTACNLPPKNEKNYLFDADYFHDTFVELKGGKKSAVVFAAIVGVPTKGDDCQGAGDEIGTCLDHKDMQYEEADFQTSDGQKYSHFKPACTRMAGDVEITSARPGRRYVKVAQKFGCRGFVYSICNPDWSEAMRKIAEMIAMCVTII